MNQIIATRVYQYGLLAPDNATAEIIYEQLDHAWGYRQSLIAIEMVRREKLRALDLSSPAVRAAYDAAVKAEASRAEAAAAVRAANAAVRSKGDVSACLHRAYAEAKAVSKKTLEDWRRSMAARRPEDRDKAWHADELYVIARDEIEATATATCKLLRERSPCSWGTQQLHDQAMSAGRTMKSTDGRTPPGAIWDGLEPHGPRMRRRHESDEMLGVQIIGGAGVAAIIEGSVHTQLRITAAGRPEALDAPDGVAVCPIKGRQRPGRSTGNRVVKGGPDRHPPGARSATYRTLRMRVASDAHHAPVWGGWPMQMHRPLPATGTIQRASVHVRRRGERRVWTAEIWVVEMRDVTRAPDRDVAIDIGWRVIREDAGSLRVAVWVDRDGDRGELRLPPRLLTALRKPEELRSTRDLNLNRMRDMLGTCRANPAWQRPAWLDQQTSHMAAWKVPARMVELHRGWQRFPGDDEIYAALTVWTKHERHLATYEAEARAQSLAARRDLYRVWARGMAERYGRVVLEDFDLRPIAKRPELEDIEPQNETARANRVLACQSRLRVTLKQAVLARDGEVHRVDAAWTTQEDPTVHARDEFDAAPAIMHVYQPSGQEWDQDVAGAVNILHRCTCERRGDDGSPGVARRCNIDRADTEKREGRWAKAKRLKAERQAEAYEKAAEETSREAREKTAEEAARKAGDKAAE